MDRFTRSSAAALFTIMEILGNTFSDLASHAVVLEGDSNHVATRSASDAVRNLGTGNRVTPPIV